MHGGLTVPAVFVIIVLILVNQNGGIYNENTIALRGKDEVEQSR